MIVGTEWVVIAVVALWLLCSCTSTKYIPVETVRDRYHTVHSTDTVTITDSVVIDRAGDTIREWRWRDRWHSRTVHDTVCLRDTIRQPYPVEVPAKLTTWERLKVEVGGWAMLILSVTIGLILCINHRKQ